MMTTFSTKATASHRYYMRKTKADIRLRIKGMIEQIDEKLLEKHVAGLGAHWALDFLWFHKIGCPEVFDHFSKQDLATIAMKAHDFLPEPAP